MIYNKGSNFGSLNMRKLENFQIKVKRMLNVSINYKVFVRQYQARPGSNEFVCTFYHKKYKWIWLTVTLGLSSWAYYCKYVLWSKGPPADRLQYLIIKQSYLDWIDSLGSVHSVLAEMGVKVDQFVICQGKSGYTT